MREGKNITEVLRVLEKVGPDPEAPQINYFSEVKWECVESKCVYGCFWDEVQGKTATYPERSQK